MTSRRIVSTTKNSEWLVESISMATETIGIPHFLEADMMRDIHITLEQTNMTKFPSGFRTMLFNLYDVSDECGEFEECLQSLTNVCRYHDAIRSSDKRMMNFDSSQLRRIRTAWRIRAYNYSKRIETRTGVDGNSVTCFSRLRDSHYITVDHLKQMYQVFDLVSFTIRVNSSFGWESTKMFHFSARNESSPFSTLFADVYEDSTDANPNGIHGNVLSYMVSKFGSAVAGRAIADMYDHEEGAGATNFLHMVGEKNPELLFHLVPFFHEKWLACDISGNTPLDNALLSKSFCFETCGHLLIQCHDCHLDKIHYIERVPICLVMIETADLSTVYYLLQRMSFDYFVGALK